MNLNLNEYGVFFCVTRRPVIMIIYKAEKDAGLTEQLRACSSVAYVSKLEPLDPASPFAVKLVKSVASTDHPSETLYPMRDVLVTTGENLNGDVFLNPEAWLARATSVHHPLNFEHDEMRIIGNITTSIAVDHEYQPIAEDSAIDELPETFHILNGSVIYRVWENAEQQALINKTIAEIEKGEWYVSMECIFKTFDIGVTRPDGSKGIIPRNESSAFLTKHLRQYGGTGIYRSEANGTEYKLSRVLRGINFIGKGLVRQPANPNSIILNHVSSFASTFANLGYLHTEAEITSPANEQPENTNMSEVNTDVKRLEDKVAELVRANEALQTQLKEVDGKAAKAQIETLTAEVAAKATLVSGLETQVTELTSTIAALTARATVAESDKATLAAEVATLKAEKVESARLALLTGKGATPEKAAELVSAFKSLDEEQFNAIVNTISVAWVQNGTTTASTAKTPEEVIQSAKAGKDANMTVPNQSHEDGEKERVAKASKFVSGFLKYTNKVPAVAGQSQD